VNSLNWVLNTDWDIGQAGIPGKVILKEGTARMEA
jgi:hypothetical protein